MQTGVTVLNERNKNTNVICREIIINLSFMERFCYPCIFIRVEHSFGLG